MIPDKDMWEMMVEDISMISDKSSNEYDKVLSVLCRYIFCQEVWA